MLPETGDSAEVLLEAEDIDEDPPSTLVMVTAGPSLEWVYAYVASRHRRGSTSSSRHYSWAKFVKVTRNLVQFPSFDQLSDNHLFFKGLHPLERRVL